jgi:hypothetical protein
MSLSAVDCQLVQNISGPECRAFFSLKINNTSEGAYFRLIFQIDYQLQGDSRAKSEKILTVPFMVCSNKKKPKAELPVVEAIKPTWGFVGQTTEVWIKGKGFGKVEVKVDHAKADVTEVAENLITVKIPASATQKKCIVIVANKFNRSTVLKAEKTLEFEHKGADSSFLPLKHSFESMMQTSSGSFESMRSQSPHLSDSKEESPL